MGFTEKQKLTVKRKAAFQCCRCKDVGVEVHHILPSQHGGRDTLDNAAPLCPSCHDRFGDNPRKCKEITQMRDWWYDVVKEKYPTGKGEDSLNDRLTELAHGELSKHDSLIAELQERVDRLAEVLSESEDEPDPDLTAAVARDVATGVVTATRLGDNTYANVHCRNCNSFTGILVGGDRCPGCGAPLL